MSFVFFLLGLVTLIVGAELLVRGASRIAAAIGISPLVVGLTVVAFGTSAPELAVSVKSALSGNTNLAVGNVVGSNIFNTLFILGLSALIAPLLVHIQIIRQEIPILIGLCILLFTLTLDQVIALHESLLLIGLCIAYTVFLIVQSRNQPNSVQAEYSKESGIDARKPTRLPIQISFVLLGLGLLVLGSNWLVDSAIVIAQSLGISDVVIGLSIVAAGTSMPEVATSIMAALKGERDIAVGNVIGSNIFNIIACLGITGILAPQGIVVPSSVVHFDLWIMLAASIACIPIFLTGREIARWEGGLFIAYYLAYVAYLILASKAHDALTAYSAVMLSFVIPLTVITLVVVLLRKAETKK
jgi:cation:H+ antiporter